MNRFSLNPLFSKLLAISLVLMVGWAIFMKGEIKPLTTDDIVRFEFAGTEAVVTQIINQWKQSGLIDLAIHGIYLDFVFIFLYTASLALGCLTFPSLTSKVSLMNWGIRLYRFSLYAGLADFLENICLMELLYGDRNGLYPAAAFGLAFIKFSIIVVILIFLFRCIIEWMIGFIRRS